ncbi:phage tail tape measure protein [Phytobacter sp. V91]|uniref:phage tail tape measure protein n=1 Tax=Phytobacter sp. V91 TaxID=3369425 RepID=UPI003F618F64
MAQAVGDLIVNLDLNDAKFTERNNYVKRGLEGIGTAANDTALEVQSAFSRQEASAKKAGISIGQYNAAMRSLPAQLTDIATQLAGGQSPFLILLQQGGQVKDSFGGLAPMLQVFGDSLFGFSTKTTEATEQTSESLGDVSEQFNNTAEAAGKLGRVRGFLTPTTLGVGALAVAVGLLIYNWYQARQQSEVFNQSLAKTGSISGQTADGLARIAAQVAKNTDVSTSSAAAAVAQATSIGLTTSQIKQVSETALIMSSTTGESVKNLVAELAKIPQDPLKAFVDINQQYNFANLALYEQVKHMVDLGDKAGATKLIIDSLGDSQKNFKDASKSDLDELADYWQGLIDKLKNYKLWSDTVADHATSVKLPQFNQGTGSAVFDNINQQMRDQSAVIATNWENINDSAGNLLGFVTQVNVKSREYNRDQVSANIEADKFLETARTNAQIRNDLQAKYQRQLDQGLISQEKFNRLTIAINEKYKDPKAPKTTSPAGDRAEDKASAELIALQAQYKVLQQHKGINDVISQQRKDLWTTEAQIQVLEDASGRRKLSAQEQSLLAHSKEVLSLKEQLAIKGDQVVAQEQLNKRMDTSAKYVTQMTAKQVALTGSASLSSRQSDRNLAYAQLESGWKNAGGKTTDIDYQKELTALNQYYATEDSLRSDWLSGANRGFSEYLDTATNVYSSMQGAAQGAMTGMSNMLTNMVTTGKASFKSFTISVLSSIAQITNQLFVAYTLQKAMGWISAAYYGPQGGGEGSASFVGPKMAWSGGYIPEYDGGGYTGPGGKYEPKGIVHGGEFVFTKESTARLGVGNLYRLMRGYAAGGYVGNNTSAISPSGVSVYAPVSITTQQGNSDQKGSTDQLGRAYQKVIDTSVREGIAKELRPGGILWAANNGR